MSLEKLLFVVLPVGLVIAFFVWPIFGMMGVYGAVPFVLITASLLFVFWPGTRDKSG